MMFDDWDWTTGIEGDDQQSTYGPGKLVRNEQDALIFLVDCNKNMFVKQEGDGDCDTHFAMVLKCIKNVYQRKVINSDRDLVSIVFYGLKKSSAGDDKPIYIFQDLAQLNSKRITDLEGIQSDPREWATSIGFSEQPELSDVFWTCSNVFSSCTKTLGFKRILLFTNEDSPHCGKQEFVRKAAAKATDLNEMGIDIELMPMESANKKFDPSQFYRNVLYDDGSADQLSSCEKFEELLTKVYKKEHKRRTFGCIPFLMSGGIEMSVGIYTLARKANKPAAVKIHRQTNAELQTATRVLNQETSADVMPQDILMYQEYSGKRITFDPEEVAHVKKLNIAGLKLVGFKKRTDIKVYLHVKPSHFIYPDERSVIGSTKLFTALLSRCLARDVIAVCWYSPRSNSTLELVHLIPQAEVLDDNEIQTVPPGFHVTIVPFKEDVRQLENADELPRASSEQVDECKNVIEKLMFKYQPDQFENPTLQKFYSNLEAMALNRDEPEDITDYTIPKDRKMLKRAETELSNWGDSIYPEGYTAPGAASKRPAASSSGAAKKAKVEPGATVDIKAEASAGRLNKMTVAVLKEIIKENNIPTTATKKADLIDAIKIYYGVF